MGLIEDPTLRRALAEYYFDLLSEEEARVEYAGREQTLYDVIQSAMVRLPMARPSRWAGSLDSDGKARVMEAYEATPGFEAALVQSLQFALEERELVRRKI